MYSLMEVVKEISVEVPDLPERLKAARVKDGRRVQLLATLSEISTGYWYKLENGESQKVSKDIIDRIQQVLGVDFGVTFDG
jgi:transcriptional regulator with XRE-family HTH domain